MATRDRTVLFLAVLAAGLAASALLARPGAASEVTVEIWGAGSVSASGGGIPTCTSSVVYQTTEPAKVCSGRYDLPSTVTFTGSAPFGFSFERWGGACSHAGTASQCTVARGSAAAIAVEARFRDAVDPRTWVFDVPRNPSPQASASLSFASSEPGSTFHCALSGPSRSHAFSGCSSPKTYAALADGVYAFQVRATDPWGRTDPTPASWTWTIDTTPPPRPALTGPTRFVRRTSATFAFTSVGASSVRCRLDAEPWRSPCFSPQTFSALDQGAHVFAVEVSDVAGNTSTAARRWTVDTIAPNTRITRGPRRVGTRRAALFRFASTERRSSFRCKLDRARWRRCTSPAVRRRLATGVHSFRVRAKDRAGNVDPTPAVRVWRVVGSRTSVVR